MKALVLAVLSLSLIGGSLVSATALAQQKTVKACRDEWRANKDANQKAGITESAYVAQCRAGGAAAAPPATQSAAPPPPQPAPTPAKPAPAPAAKPAATPAGAHAGANRFSAEAQAKARCPSDTIVWANTSSNIYHFAGNKNYGNTKEGAYMCERDAAAQGIRAAKNEKHP
jgi:hypothetical protein